MMYLPEPSGTEFAVAYAPNGDDWFLHATPRVVIVGEEERTGWMDSWVPYSNAANDR